MKTALAFLVLASGWLLGMEVPVAPNKKMVLIVGPTRSGKSTLAELLVQRCGQRGICAERISVDDTLLKLPPTEYDRLLESYDDLYSFVDQFESGAKQRIDRSHYPLAVVMKDAILSALKNTNGLTIVDYVSASSTGRRELACAIEPYRAHILLLKLMCKRDVAQRRLEFRNAVQQEQIDAIMLDPEISPDTMQEKIISLRSKMRFSSSIETYYTDPNICDLPGLRYDIEYDTSEASCEYNELADRVMNQIS